MKRFGFTLVELLVVISVIGLLMAIMLLALSAVRQQARQTACQARIRQLHLKLNLYNTENDSLPPGINSTYPIPSSIFRMTTAMDPIGLWWIYYIDLVPDSHFDDKSLLRCPANKLTSLTFKYELLYGNYGVNWSLCRSPSINSAYREFRGQPLSLDSLKNPGQTLLLVDSGYTLIGWKHTLPANHAQSLAGSIHPLNNAYLPGASVNSSKNPLLPDDTADAVEGRHPHQTVNVAYADGHVMAEKADDLVVQPLEAEGEFANLSPLWKP